VYIHSAEGVYFAWISNGDKYTLIKQSAEFCVTHCMAPGTSSTLIAGPKWLYISEFAEWGSEIEWYSEYPTVC
jgi:hypothetical protein